MAENSRARQWLVVAVAVAFGLVYLSSFQLLNQKWSYSTGAYSHGYLILVLVLYLLATASSRIPTAEIAIGWLAIVGVFGSGLLWLIAYVGNVMFVQAIMLPIILLFVLLIIFGLGSLRVWLFPLAYFVFAIPIWDYANGLLQHMTVTAVTTLLTAFNVSAYISGSVVQLSVGVFEIEAGCAGLGFFIVALALSSLYAYSFLRFFRNRLALVVIGASMAIAMNWIRVTSIILAGYMSDMQHYLVTVDHYNFGWVLFGVMLIPLFLIARRIEDSELEHIDKKTENRPRENSINRYMVYRAVIAVSVASVAPVLANALDRFSAESALPSIALPTQLGDWSADRRYVDYTIEYPGASSSASINYSRGDELLTFFANAYGRQKPGAELISNSSRPLDRDKWEVLNSAVVSIEVSSAAVPTRRLEVSDSYGNRRAVYYWYAVGSRSFVDERRVKIAEVLQTLSGEPTSGVRLITAACATTCDSTNKTIEEFISEHGARLNNMFEDKEGL